MSNWDYDDGWPGDDDDDTFFEEEFYEDEEDLDYDDEDY